MFWSVVNVNFWFRFRQKIFKVVFKLDVFRGLIHCAAAHCNTLTMEKHTKPFMEMNSLYFSCRHRGQCEDPGDGHPPPAPHPAQSPVLLHPQSSQHHRWGGQKWWGFVFHARPPRNTQTSCSSIRPLTLILFVFHQEYMTGSCQSWILQNISMDSHIIIMLKQ